LNPPELYKSRRLLGLSPWIIFLAACVGLGMADPLIKAQAVDATNLRVPIKLGATGVFNGEDNPAFARPDYDDSKWLPTDDKRPIHELTPSSQPEIVWQRIHVKVSPDETGLGLEAYNVADAFELYVNGQRVLESGQFTPLVPYTTETRLVARIPDAQVVSGNLVIAIRERTRPSWWRQSSDIAFFAEMLTLGQNTPLADHVALGMIQAEALSWLVSLLGVGVSVVALALFTTQRQRKEYLWLALQGSLIAIYLTFALMESVRTIPVGFTYLYPLLSILIDFFTILMMFAFVRRKLRGWLRTYIVLCCICGLALRWEGLWQGWSGLSLPGYIQILWLSYAAIFAFVIPAVLIVHLRRGNWGEGILLIPVVSWSLYSILFGTITVMNAIPQLQKIAAHLSQTTQSFALGPFALGSGSVTSAIGYISLAIIIVQRATRTSRQETLLEGEIAAARQIQQIIQPEQIESIPGFSIECVYQPAQQVGGDFFQVLPAGEGGLLLVLGDVAGKGLPAAMLVSVLVGATRATAEYTHVPAELLASLNERMIGRSKGFSTALAAYIAADGAGTIANAGHLSPYLDGEEIALPGALPLGIMSGASYETIQFELRPGSRLTFYSDGVIEAQNEKGQLFGFEQSRAISTQPAEAIVEAARRFGQSDDITVVAITRNLPFTDANNVN
jgi:phosphoserine phosphatase RsbU/P